MDSRGNDHVDWWAVSVKQRRELDELRAQRSQLNTALHTAVKQRDKAEAENERLRADLAASERLREHANRELAKDSAMVEQLRAALKEIADRRGADHPPCRDEPRNADRAKSRQGVRCQDGLGSKQR